MNRNLNSKSSLVANIAHSIKQSAGVIALGAVAGTVAPVLAIAFHFPGW